METWAYPGISSRYRGPGQAAAERFLERETGPAEPESVGAFCFTSWFGHQHPMCRETATGSIPTSFTIQHGCAFSSWTAKYVEHTCAMVRTKLLVYFLPWSHLAYVWTRCEVSNRSLISRSFIANREDPVLRGPSGCQLTNCSDLTDRVVATSLTPLEGSRF